MSRRALDGLPPGRDLALVPISPLEPAFARRVAAALSRRLTLPCRLTEGDPDPGPRLTGRDQHDADALLARLEARPRPHGGLVVGLTGADLAISLFTYVFGRARVGGGVAVVSVARLRPAAGGRPPDPAATLRRTVAEVLHELGHAVGLVHCPRHDCLMHFAPTVERADLRGDRFCPACEAELPKGLLAGGAARRLRDAERPF